MSMRELETITYVYEVTLNNYFSATWLNNKYVRYFLATFYKVVSPLIIIIILLIDWASYKPFTKGDYVYPGKIYIHGYG